MDRSFSITLNVTVMSSMDLSASVLCCSFLVTKGAEAVRRLPTKNSLELFINNSGFRGVVLMDRIVFV